MMETLISLVLLAFGLFIYFMPTINARERKHNSTAAIFAANVLLGWTVLGWIGCLIWSFSGNRQRVDPDAPTPQTHVRCPECRELVRCDAIKCKHCGCALIPQ